MPAKPPYYESRYIRANHPDQPQALWLRETLLLPTAGEPVADVWVMVFDPDGAGNRALKQPYPIDAAEYDYENWTRADRRRRHRRPVGARCGHRRQPVGALGPADHTGRRGSGETAHRARVPRTYPDRQDDGAPSAGAVRRPARARRRACRRRRLDGQRQPQLGHQAHPGLRVRPGVRVRQRAGFKPGDRHGARRDRPGADTGGHAVRIPPCRRGIRGALDPEQPADARPLSAVCVDVRWRASGST